MNDIEKAKEILNQYNQCHVASLFDKIDKAKQEELAKQVLNIDFHKIVELYDNTKKEIEIKDKEIKPIEYLDKEKMCLSHIIYFLLPSLLLIPLA